MWRERKKTNQRKNDPQKTHTQQHSKCTDLEYIVAVNAVQTNDVERTPHDEPSIAVRFIGPSRPLTGISHVSLKSAAKGVRHEVFAPPRAMLSVRDHEGVRWKKRVL